MSENNLTMEVTNQVIPEQDVQDVQDVQEQAVQDVVSLESEAQEFAFQDIEDTPDQILKETKGKKVKEKKPKAPKEPKKPKAPKTPKEPKTSKAPKEPKKPKTPKAPGEKKSVDISAVLKQVKTKVSTLKLPKINMPKGSNQDDEQTQKPMKQSKYNMLFSIRNKIALCFVVPMVFMIIIGVSAYQKAADGMSQKYQETSLQTIKMATEYVDTSLDFIASEGMTYAFDDGLSKYSMGLYDDKPIEKADLLTRINSDIMSSQATNPFISNIHIVTRAGVKMMSSKSADTVDGCFDEYIETVSTGKRSIERWVDTHEYLDNHLLLKAEDYIMAFEMLAQNNKSCVVIDIKQEAIREFLEGLDMGKGSVVGFVTKTGREIICEKLEEGEESRFAEGTAVFFGQEFFSAIGVEEEPVLEGTKEVKFMGDNYLFIYSRSEETAATICALVPIDVVTEQASDIGSLTVKIVILASVIVLVVGVAIVMGIQNNMVRISKKFGEVAKGDLTVQVSARGRDEFNNLASSATHMIKNTKNLVNKVSNATGQLEESAKDVEQASGIIDDYSKEITRAISEINEGMARQSRHAQDCVDKTDVLSNEMQEVSRVVERVESLVEETEGMINKGMEIVYLLGDRASQTTNITEKVGESIESLRKETEIINSFVKTITDISEQTNLLSLNASIEAARAGDAGRGFAVVAEEIRKLADDSAKAAGEIRNNVGVISAQTQESVKSAREARSMVDLQTAAVEEVVSVFIDMQNRMAELVDGLKDIVTSTERADSERSDAVDAVRNISDIIEETAASAETVSDVAAKLLENVERLNHTADVLGENMDGLKTEISVFKI